MAVWITCILFVYLYILFSQLFNFFSAAGQAEDKLAACCEELHILRAGKDIFPAQIMRKNNVNSLSYFTEQAPVGVQVGLLSHLEGNIEQWLDLDSSLFRSLLKSWDQKSPKIIKEICIKPHNLIWCTSYSRDRRNCAADVFICLCGGFLFFCHREQHYFHLKIH